ncbi:MAG: competence/damage-inducible protein A [Betaproteobacteria bacterium]|nr:competence/damage-inducible protein A [Betaproteobacteria bacterium]
MSQQAFAALIIGDEILSGKRQDKHLAKAIELLKARGLALSWARYLGDDPALITATLKESFATDFVVFSFGGIGATPDDHTRQCAAAALGVALHIHPEAEAEMRAKENFEITPTRLRMAEFPLGSRVIPNPYNRIAAFSVHQHHFLPGFPEMAWPMMEWVLDREYSHCFHRVREVEQSIVIHDAGESHLISAMERILANHPGLRLSSLPQHIPNVDGNGGVGRLIEFSLKGDAASVEVGMAEMKTNVHSLGFRFEVKS